MHQRRHILYTSTTEYQRLLYGYRNVHYNYTATKIISSNLLLLVLDMLLKHQRFRECLSNIGSMIPPYMMHFPYRIYHRAG
jgi:hypothetical protein